MIKYSALSLTTAGTRLKIRVNYTTPDRWQSKTLIPSTKVDTEFSIAICRPTGILDVSNFITCMSYQNVSTGRLY